MVTKAVAAHEKAVADGAKKNTEAHKREADAVKKFHAERLQARREEEDAIKRISQSQAQAATKLREVGEGAFTLARGLALTFTSTDEGLQKMLRNVAQVQGFFDIYKGGSKLVLDGASALGALEKAGGLASVAMKGLSLAISPVGLGIAGVTAVVGGFAAAWAFFKDDAPEYVRASSGALKQLNRELEFAEKNVGRFGSVTGREFRDFAARTGNRELSSSLIESEKNQTVFGAIKAQGDAEKRIQQIEQEQATEETLQQILRNKVVVRKAELDINNANRLAIQEQLLLNERDVETTKRALEVRKQTLAAVKAVEQAQREAKLSDAERFGILAADDPQAAAKLRGIAQRGGPQNIEEAKFARSTGFGLQQAGKIFQEFGGQQGFEDIDVGLGAAAARAEAIKQATDAAATKLAEIGLETQQQVASMEQFLEQSKSFQAESFKTINKILEETVKQQAELNSRLQQIDDLQAQSQAQNNN